MSSGSTRVERRGRVTAMGILALWATPRTVSTAFERMVIERGDHLVLDEPWSRAYYFGPDRQSDRFPLCFPEATYAAVTAGVLRLGTDHDVFVKDMAYQALPGLDDVDLASMTHTFLVRDPGSALRSLHREWPDCTDEEAGHAAQRALFDRVVAATGATPAVIDSDDLRRDPEGVVEAWCAAVGIPHRPDTLTWQAGMRPEWPLWREWYGAAAASTGFAAPQPPPDAPIPVEVAPLVVAALPHYEHLAGHALSARAGGVQPGISKPSTSTP